LLALDTDYSSLRRSLGIDDRDVVFGYIGRFVPIKDLPTMLRALAAALPKAPRARLLMAGDGALRGELERLANDLGITHAVRFVGWRHDLTTVYATIDAAILSSRNEGTPVALIEAMAAGKPVIATDVGGVRDVFLPDRTGLLVEAGDVARLAEAIVRLAGAPTERRSMGEAARSDARVRFHDERLVAEIGNLYAEGLAQKRRQARVPAAGPGV
jgi:glycosyltransferase involved in cell wall biosynthesis